MDAHLVNTKKALHALVNALRETVTIMPKKNALTGTREREIILSTIHSLDLLVAGLDRESLLPRENGETGTNELNESVCTEALIQATKLKDTIYRIQNEGPYDIDYNPEQNSSANQG